MEKQNFRKNQGGGGTATILKFQRDQLKKLEFAEPISEETETLLELVLEFLHSAQELETTPQSKRVEAIRKLNELRGKMELLNKISATGKELLLSEGMC